MSWRFELAHSSDMSNIAELRQARGRSLTCTLNRAGALNFSVPLDSDIASDIYEVVTCVKVSLDDDVVWSGPVWTCEESIDGSKASLNVGCVGWLQTLDKRVVRPTWNRNQSISYRNVEAGAIAHDLLTRSNSDALAAGAPSYVVPGTYEVTQLRTRTYQPWSGILTSINELTEIESGFDMIVDPETRALNIYAAMKNATECRYQLGNNVATVSRNTDAGRMINYMTAYSSSAGYAAVTDPDSCATYGLYEEAQSLSDVVNPTILAAFAAAEIAVKHHPLSVITFTPKPETYVPFRDFNVGDTVELTAQHGRLQITEQLLRMFSFSVGESRNGTFGAVSGIQTVAQ